MKARLPPTHPISVDALTEGDYIFLPYNTSDLNDRRMVTYCRITVMEYELGTIIVEPIKHYAIDKIESEAKNCAPLRTNECYETVCDAFVALVERNESDGERLNQEALEFDRMARAARTARANVLRAANLIRPQAAAQARIEMATA